MIYDINKLEILIADFLKELKPDFKQHPDFKETPKRVAKMYAHFFRDSEQSEITEIMEKVFPTNNDQLVIVKDIEAFGLCPHHLLPIVYKIHIGYIPNGKALGLSKFARLSIALAGYPKLQENLTSEIADALEQYLEPLGLMVVVNGVHGCMRCRGVEMDSATITSDCRGILREKQEARMEFLELVKN